jgi:hypothetical protein
VEPFADVSDARTTDVSATLDELERKLRDLEAELQVTASPAPQPAAPAPSPPPAPPPEPRMDAAERLIADARSRLRELGDQIDGLLSFREDLARIARELDEEYARTLGRVIGEPPAPPAAPEPAPSPPEPLAPPAPDPLEGTLIVDAGPFADLAALTAFERALGRAPGVEDVYVSGFDDRRATIEVRVSAPTALDDLLAGEVSRRITGVSREGGTLRIEVRPDAP